MLILCLYHCTKLISYVSLVIAVVSLWISWLGDMKDRGGIVDSPQVIKELPQISLIELDSIPLDSMSK